MLPHAVSEKSATREVSQDSMSVLWRQEDARPFLALSPPLRHLAPQPPGHWQKAPIGARIVAGTPRQRPDGHSLYSTAGKWYTWMFCKS